MSRFEKMFVLLLLAAGALGAGAQTITIPADCKDKPAPIGCTLTKESGALSDASYAASMRAPVASPLRQQLADIGSNLENDVIYCINAQFGFSERTEAQATTLLMALERNKPRIAALIAQAPPEPKPQTEDEWVAAQATKLDGLVQQK